MDCKFRKQVMKMLPDSMHIWLSKSFANFTGTAYQLCRQGLLSTSTYRICNAVQEMDTLHVLFCPHRIFQLYKHKVVSTLQLKLLALLEEDIFPLCFLEWMLDKEYTCIEGVLPNVMLSLQSIGRRNIWFSFLPSIFTQWVKWKYESTK